MTIKNTIVKAGRSFDPFEQEHLFHEYTLKISKDEINQIRLLFKYPSVNSIEQLTTYKSFNILETPLLKNIKKQVINILNKHGLLLDNNWAQLYNKNNFHSTHNHYGSAYSGIIYLKGKKASPTIFYSRDMGFLYTHQFKKNKLILFPSLVHHEVRSLNKNEERLVISFNTKIK